MSPNNGHSNNGNSISLRLKTGLAEMLKGGVIMDVTDAKQAEIAQRAGAVSVMALERVPAQIRAEGGVARMASPKKIREIMAAVDIPVMAKCRIGHFAEGQIVQEMKILTVLSEEELYAKAKEHQAPYELIRMVARDGKLPVPNFSAGGIATPADASLVMQLGAEAVFVGSGIFMKNSTEFADPQEAEKRARAIVKAATHYNDPKVLLEVSEDLIGAMKGLAVSALDEAHMLQTRGW